MDEPEPVDTVGEAKGDSAEASEEEANVRTTLIGSERSETSAATANKPDAGMPEAGPPETPQSSVEMRDLRDPVILGTIVDSADLAATTADKPEADPLEAPQGDLEMTGLRAPVAEVDLEADLEADGARPASPTRSPPSEKTYGCSWRTQLKLVCWKNCLTYVRDKKTIGAYIVYPCIMCILSFSFRRVDFLPLDQERNLDYILLALGMILVPMLQSLYLVTERKTGQRELMALHGLSPFIYRIGFLVSEFILSAVMAFAICLCALLVRVMGPVESIVSFTDLFAILMVFCVSSCSFIMALSPCFRKPMTASMIIFLLYFGSIFVFLFAGGSDEAFIHDSVGRDNGPKGAERKICRDLYPNDRNGARHMDHMWKEGKSDPNKGAMRKWWKFFDDDYRKAQPIVIDDGGGNGTETTALYCYTLGV